MAGSDSFQLVLNELIKDINDINDKFAVIGIFYFGKFVVKSINLVYQGSRTYLIPRLFSNEQWLKSLGDWAIVTGSNHGIGLGYARELAKRKINLILIDKNPSLLDKIAEYLIKNYKIEVIKISLDLNDIDSFSLIEKSIISRDIGILVNAAGATTDPCYYHNASKKSINELINVNTLAVCHLTRMVLPSMVQRNKGAIVYVSSLNSMLPSPYNTIYGATNCFIEKLAESLRFEYRHKNVYFQCLNPYFYNAKTVLNMNYKLLKNNDGIKYSNFAIRTLGYSNHTFGDLLKGLKFTVLNLIPRCLLNMIYSAILRRKFLNQIENSTYANNEDNDEDIDIAMLL